MYWILDPPRSGKLFVGAVVVYALVAVIWTVQDIIQRVKEFKEKN
jgi:hypothetical protein